MKTNKYLIAILSFVAVIAMSSCVEDDDYTIPEIIVPTVDVSTLGAKTTFDNVIARYNDAVADGDPVGTWEFDAPLYIEAYVVSNDIGGNFFEEIIIQNSIDGNDLTDDTRRGLKLEVNQRNLSNIYNFGRKVYVKLNGLAVNISNGVYTLGKANGNSLVQLEPYEYADFIIRDSEVATITPKMVAIADLTENDENTFVQISDAQFIKSNIESTNNYAGEVTDQFDGFRTIENCATGSTITLQTSTFSSFKSETLNPGRGTIEGVYSRDFGDDFSVLIISNPENAIQFDSSDRCDPVVLECTGTSGGGNAIFAEDFEGFSNYAAEGWTMTNVDGNSVDWFISSFSGNNYSRISAFNSGESAAEVWLVTPDVDLDTTTGEEFSFDVQASYDNGTILSVMVSDDFTGDVETATWTEIDATIPSGPSNTFGSFQTVGPINISCLDGAVNFAFVYSGSDPSATTRYHLDNVEVTGNN